MIPLIVVIGMAALRSTWRRTTGAGQAAADRRLHVLARHLLAHATRVTRATIASAESGERDRGQREVPEPVEQPVPAPSAGNQPSLTAKTEISTIAATNDGIAANTVVPDDHRRVERPAAKARERPPSRSPESRIRIDA